MHGANIAIGERRTFRLLAPRRLVLPATGSKPSDTPQPESPERDRTLVTAFRSPATAAPREASIPGSKFPACHFASSPAGFAARSAFLLHSPFRFAPVPAVSMLLARCSSLDWLAGCVSSFHSPLGVLPPSGSKRSTGSAAARPTCRIRPIPSRSPQPVLSLVVAADHRSWVATFPEACCSLNLLEPSSLCPRSGFWSMLSCVR